MPGETLGYNPEDSAEFKPLPSWRESMTPAERDEVRRIEEGDDEKAKGIFKMLDDDDLREQQVYKGERKILVPLERAKSVAERSAKTKELIDKSKLGTFLERYETLNQGLRNNLLSHLKAKLEEGADPASQLVDAMQRMEQMAKFQATPDEAEELENTDTAIRSTVNELIRGMEIIDEEKAKQEEQPESRSLGGRVN